MMAILKEYICMAHGEFEGFEPACPHGCSGTMVERQFRTAPGYPQTIKGIDQTLDNLAKDFNMTDMRHNSNGSIAGGGNQDFAPRWGKDGLKGLQQQGHQLGHSGLQAVAPVLRRPESMIPADIKAASAKELIK
jgi:hypothetical protein